MQRSRPTGNSADTSSPESESEYTVLAWLTDSSWRGSAASAPEGEPRSGCCGIGEDEDIWCDAGFQSFFGGSVVGFMNRSRTLGESHPADDGKSPTAAAEPAFETPTRLDATEPRLEDEHGIGLSAPVAAVYCAPPLGI